MNCASADRDFLEAVLREVARARAKFPGNQHRLAALSEEHGEVAKALLDGEPHGVAPLRKLARSIVLSAARPSPEVARVVEAAVRLVDCERENGVFGLRIRDLIDALTALDAKGGK